eukprot:CAMPEP_0185845758 /NCGR_PEP_ID=MMETSP1354-20130828/1638_1 /TAXON_ID=708628 /ORGANISM="Erythrolobus madagascarensis, Strain CCMP3276" /LENGTH=152 /DNA_ID=CAMNT_0028545795 /DNA_START=27 /DNA_END=485 /DNA_ORIENTATION=-
MTESAAESGADAAQGEGAGVAVSSVEDPVPAAVPEGMDVDELEPLSMNVRNAQIAEKVSQFRLHENDSGSPEAQIAKLSIKITMLTEHAKRNPKDHSSTRGLLKMVALRKRLLNYLRTEDPDRFANLVSGLNIRLSKDQAYAAKAVQVATEE